jgi:tRNA(Leu) C34 or U34 (ribose-2'-O)-methylase TrmL
LAVVVEKTTDVHNYTAVLRTAEAIGVQHVYMICPPLKPVAEVSAGGGDSGGDGGGGDDPAPGFTKFDEDADEVVKNNSRKSFKKNKKAKLWEEDQKMAREHIGFARTAVKWITIHNFTSTKSCMDALRKDGYEIWATDLGQGAVSLTLDDCQLTVPPKLAIVFGTESTGCSEEMLTTCDQRVYLPLTGFADSLNLSVAAAMVMQHLFYMDPSLAGAMSKEERQQLREQWFVELARDGKEEVEFKEIADKGEGGVRPFKDLRRSDAHRGGWRSKKVVRKSDKRFEAMDGGGKSE